MGLRITLQIPITVAKTIFDVQEARLKQCPVIVYQESAHEVVVYTNMPAINHRISEGGSWSTGEEVGKYMKYYYTRLSLEQVCEHLIDPSKHCAPD